LREAAENKEDDIEVIIQANTTEIDITNQYPPSNFEFDFSERILRNPKYNDSNLLQRSGDQELWTVDAASWHQKMTVIDQQISYVTGMNTKQDDWDDNRPNGR